MNNAIVKVLVAGKRIGPESDSPRELIPTLIERPCLDGDEFDLSAYIRELENILNDEDVTEEEFYQAKDRIEFLGGSISWESEYLDGTGDVTAFVNL